MQLTPFDYHKKLTAHFKNQQKTWEWFSKAEVQEEQLNLYKKELLKNTYRLSEDSEEKIYSLIQQAKKSLGIPQNVIIYQELNSIGNNASVIQLGDEIHITLSGNLLKNLSEKELLSVFAHELSHILFLQLENGDFEVTNRIIRSIANDARSSTVMSETARLYQLYIELFCDKGSLYVVEDLDTVVETLVKVSAGLDRVSAKNYLKQAREIFDQEDEGTQQHSHPETFIRSRALEIIHLKEDEAQIEKMIDANWGLNRLDLFKQEELTSKTKIMLELMTKPKWTHTENMHAMCRNYFPSFHYSSTVVIDKEIEDLFPKVDDTIREYFSYMLLDFCFADSSLEKAPIGHAFQIAEALEFDKTFKQILKKELKLTVKKLKALINEGVKQVSELSESEEESILQDQ